MTRGVLAECHPSLAEIEVLLLFFRAAARKLDFLRIPTQGVESLVLHAGWKSKVTHWEGEDARRLRPKNGDSPAFQSISPSVRICSSSIS